MPSDDMARAVVYLSRLTQWGCVALAAFFTVATLGSTAVLAAVWALLAVVCLLAVGVVELLSVRPATRWTA